MNKMQNNIDFWIRKCKFSAPNYWRIMQSNFHTRRAVAASFSSNLDFHFSLSFYAFAVRRSGCLFVCFSSFQFSLLHTRFNGSLKLINKIPSHITHWRSFHRFLFQVDSFVFVKMFWFQGDKHQTIIFLRFSVAYWLMVVGSGGVVFYLFLCWIDIFCFRCKTKRERKKLFDSLEC